MKREEIIRNAMESMPDFAFQRFAVELLSRTLYPGLNPSSLSHDLGEDARSEDTTVFLNVEHQGKRVSVAVSKTGGPYKLRSDCERCRQTNRRIEVFVFVTVDDVRTDVENKWRHEIQADFGWELELRTARWLAPAASRPEHETLVDDYLQIPPPGGDYAQNIDASFAAHTERALRSISITIPGLTDSLAREEVERVEDQFANGRGVLLTGEPGTGKSGIAACLARSASDVGKGVLLLDARDCAHVRSETELRRHLGLSGPLAAAASRLGRYTDGCRLIIDQLDSTSGLDSARVLANLACETCHGEHVEVLVVSRRTEANEQTLARGLTGAGFVEVTSHPLRSERAEGLLRQLGIAQPPPELVRLAQNLLNLELIACIHTQQPGFSLATLSDEAELWDQYTETLLRRERVVSEPRIAEEMLAEAASLSREGLRADDRTFLLPEPRSRAQMRLASWQIIVHEEGFVFRFRHDKLQDFLYARNAVDRGLRPLGVLAEIPAYRTRNVFRWMAILYERRNSRHYLPFLKEVFHGLQ